jgi:hypothetical protein
MPRIFIALVALLALIGAAHSETPPPMTALKAALFTQAHPDNGLLRSRTLAGSARSTSIALTCCTVCSVGKACGNTCISRDKTCHVGQGCACDG